MCLAAQITGFGVIPGPSTVTNQRKLHKLFALRSTTLLLVVTEANSLFDRDTLQRSICKMLHGKSKEFQYAKQQIF